MKKKYSEIPENIRIIGIRGTGRRSRVVDFYLVSSKNGREYAFTRKYSKRTYDLVKSGVSIKKLLSVRSKDHMVMKVVRYLSYMMPYFMEEIGWMAA